MREGHSGLVHTDVKRAEGSLVNIMEVAAKPVLGVANSQAGAVTIHLMAFPTSPG